MRISVVGTGYVGLVSGVCFAELGHDCTCIDVDRRKVDQINAGSSPIHERDLEPMLRRHAGSRLTATTNLREAVLASDITFIAVGTPFDGERIDLRHVRVAARDIGTALRDKSDYHVVVVKSTVVPGTTDGVVRPELESASGRQAGRDFGVGMNPEFLTEGVAVSDFMRPDRIVLGGIDQRSIAVQELTYAGLPATPIVRTNNKTAELIKYTSNSVLATMISFSNEIANLCSALGNVDVAEVMRAVHLARYFTTVLEDGRRVPAGINSFLWAGCGYGGSCLPKDTKALSAHATAHGAPMPVLDAVIATNTAQPQRLVATLARHFDSLKGVRVALLGLAFKEDTDDVRESPALPIAHELIASGVDLIAYDPVATAAARPALPDRVRYADRLEDAVADVDAVMLVTRWSEFERLPELLAGRRQQPVVIDGRRVLPPAAFQRYDGIGR